jgi:hypothetical protein
LSAHRPRPSKLQLFGRCSSSAPLQQRRRPALRRPRRRSRPHRQPPRPRVSVASTCASGRCFLCLNGVLGHALRVPALASVQARHRRPDTNDVGRLRPWSTSSPPRVSASLSPSRTLKHERHRFLLLWQSRRRPSFLVLPDHLPVHVYSLLVSYRFLSLCPSLFPCLDTADSLSLLVLNLPRSVLMFVQALCNVAAAPSPSVLGALRSGDALLANPIQPRLCPSVPNCTAQIVFSFVSSKSN